MTISIIFISVVSLIDLKPHYTLALELKLTIANRSSGLINFIIKKIVYFTVFNFIPPIDPLTSTTNTTSMLDEVNLSDFIEIIAGIYVLFYAFIILFWALASILIGGVPTIIFLAAFTNRGSSVKGSNICGEFESFIYF